MKSAGFALLVAGFLIGAYATALDIDVTNWTLFVPAALAAAAGVFLIKRHARGHAQSSTVLEANRTELKESLTNISAQLDELKALTPDMETAQIHLEVDDRLRDDLRRFADARESLIHLFDMQTYADIMSEFAAGERYVNRVWSASADGYRGEALRYLDKASVQFHEALSRLNSAAG